MARDLTSLYYKPEPQKPGENLAEYVERELSRISTAFIMLSAGYNEVLYVAPAKPENGMIVIADGTSWNPGAGAGAYERKAGAWVKL